VFEARAIDAAGNVDPSPASRAFTVDTAAPETLITLGPDDPTNDSTPVFGFRSDDPTATFECRVDSAAFATCTSPHTTGTLSNGTHTFEVRAVDAGGHADQTPASQTFSVDTTAPNTTITSAPANPTSSTDAVFEFTSNESGVTFECELDGADFASCSSGVTYGGLSDGSHTFRVRARDAAGNLDPSAASRTWTINTAAPDTTVTSGPSGVTNDATPSFSFNSNDSSAIFECRIDGPGGATGTWSSCTSPKGYSLSDGSYTFMVRAKNSVGAVDGTPDSRAFEVDASPPSTSIDSGPSGSISETSATFSFSSSDPGSSFECKLDAAPFEPCTSPQPYTGLPDGSHTFQVRATDAAGNPDTSPASRTFTVDTTPPDTSITSGPANGSTTTDDTPTFAFSSTGGGTGFECRVDSDPFGPCTSPVTTGPLGDGSHTFDVRAIDAAGNFDPSAASRAFTVDTSAPETSITLGPSGPTNDPTPTFSFSSDDSAATFECRVDSAAFAACARPYTTGTLSNGNHTFEVRAVDSSGHADQTPASGAFTVDTVAPNSTITSAPANPTSSTSASFQFNSNENGVSFECKLDNGAFGPCTSPTGYADLSDGSHTFRVRARDAAGNLDLSEATHTWTINTTVPDTTITSGPSGLIKSASPSFGFTSNESGVTFECRLDESDGTTGSWDPCTSPKDYTLTDGSYTFMVRAKNSVGTVDPAPASRSFSIDATAPSTSIDSGPSGPINQTSASFSFSSPDASGFECRLDAESFLPCSSPKAYTGLADGSHTFQVRATDTAGNADQTPASRAFTVDTVPPDTSISSGPANGSTNTTGVVTFAFSTTGGGSALECQMDGAGFTPCTSPETFNVSDGPHEFEVRALDAAGNIDPSPSRRTFTVDTIGPDTFITLAPPPVTNDTTPTFGFNSDDPSATFQCKLDGPGSTTGSFGSCTSPKNYSSALANGSYTFRVRATDSQNRTDASPPSFQFTVDTTPPQTTITSGPANGSTSNFASGSFTFTSNEPNSTFECRLGGPGGPGSFAPCSSPYSFGPLPDGTYTLSVGALDQLGNRELSPITRSWTIDRTPPDTIITSGPPSPTKNNIPTFTIASEPGATLDCRLFHLDGSANPPSTAVNCTGGTWTPTAPLADGTYRLSATAKDAVLNVDPTPATRDFTVDTARPTTTIADPKPQTVNGFTNETAATFNFTSSEAGSTFECRLDKQGTQSLGFQPCTSPRTYPGLTDGSYTFRVRATDPALNVDTNEATFSWTVNTAIPQTSITAAPPALTNNTTATLRFSSNQPSPPATFECRLDGGAWESCSSPRTYTGLSAGNHAFEVAAVVGRNRDTEPDRRTWTVDLTPPDTVISSGPAGDVASQFATFAFSSEPGTGFECKLDGGNWSGCGSPRVYGGLALGAHTVHVRAVDAAGNADPSPAARTWKVVGASVQASGPRLITPFPVVRIAGTIRRGGVKLKLLAVSATSGSKISIRCRGRGCPFKRRSQKASAGKDLVRAARLIQIRRMKGRYLRAGARIEIFITKTGLIGKYTRFQIRGGKAPSRLDRCLMPGSRKPVRCPPA
jgi:hypothetical protein